MEKNGLNKIQVWLFLFLFVFNSIGLGFAQQAPPVKGAMPPAATVASGSPAVDPMNEKISVDYKDTDIGDMLRSLSYTYGLNLVTSAEVKGKITISLKDVTLLEALDALLVANGYNYSKKGNIIYITPGAGEGAQIVNEPVVLNYLKAQDAQNVLRKALSPKGDIKVDEISNMLIVSDYPANIEKLKLLLKAIDKPPRQVLIEAKIVDITSKDLRNLGVTWQADLNPGKGLFSRENVETISERIKGTGTLTGPSSSLSGGQFKLDTLVLKGLTGSATLDALIQEQKAHLLASPSIAVLNNREARIIIGEKVPYKERTQTTTGTTETTKFIDVGTTLRVTPSINADGYITLNIHPEVSSVQALLDAGPRITTREADTMVRVKEGETIVIGGLIKQEDNRTNSKVPILGYIPILGLLFSNSSKDQTQTELAVFITPKILRSREEMLIEQKTHYEEEAYVNILANANLNVQSKLLETARNLQANSGLEPRDKERWQRKHQALSIYQSIFTQFPEGPKAAEAGYQAAVLYYELDELYEAKELAKKISSSYPDSVFAVKANNLVRVINEKARREASRRAEAELLKVKRLTKEEDEAARKMRLAQELQQKANEREASDALEKTKEEQRIITKEMMGQRAKEKVVSSKAEAQKKTEAAAAVKEKERKVAEKKPEIIKKPVAEKKEEKSQQKAVSVSVSKEPDKASEKSRLKEERLQKEGSSIREKEEARKKLALEKQKQAEEKARLREEERKKADAILAVKKEGQRRNRELEKERLKKERFQKEEASSRTKEELRRKAAEEKNKRAQKANRRKEEQRVRALTRAVEKEEARQEKIKAQERKRRKAKVLARIKKRARDKAKEEARLRKEELKKAK